MSRSGGRSGRHRHPRHSGGLGANSRETAMSLAPDSPVLALFRSTAVQLNARHDRHERLVKLSRDITIESKRVIFLLHSAITKEDSEKAVTEANQRLSKLIDTSIKSIALELEESPNYLHTRAISPGLQEFIEAKTLCHLIQNGTLVTCSQVQKEFVFTIKGNEGEEDRVIETLLPPVDFILGVADLTGELMRRTINSLASGDADECNRSCQLVRDLYCGFLGIMGAGKEVGRKMSTTRANVSKVEAAVYALHVRGGEAPPALLLPPREAVLPADIEQHDSDDEGYF